MATPATASPDKLTRRQAQADKKDDRGGGAVPLLLLLAGAAGLGLYELLKGKSPSSGGACTFTAGTLLRATDTGGVYIVNHDGSVSHISDPEVVSFCYANTPATAITSSQLSGCRQGPEITNPPCPPVVLTPGMLLRQFETGGVYIVNPDGTVSHFRDPQAVFACYGNALPVQVTLEQVAAFRMGPEITGPPCPPGPPTVP